MEMNPIERIMQRVIPNKKQFGIKYCIVILEHGWKVAQDGREELVIIKRKTVNDEVLITALKKKQEEDRIQDMGKEIILVGRASEGPL